MPDAVGLPAFRSTVVEHLLRHRGLAADPGAVLATGGTTAAVAELARTLPRGARVAVEEPGYQRAAAALRGAGLAVLPVPVDGDGLVVDALPAGLAAVYCTPAHQFPLGARLSAARRVALVARARAEGFLVVEDDYDGELRYDVAPLPLLAALGPDVVVHLGTASKLLTPTLGVGWLVAPPAVRAAVVAQRDRGGVRPARAGQRVFAALAAHGDLGRHLRRLRRELAQRRRAVVAAVAAAGMPVCGDAAGAHVVVRLADPAAEEAAVAAAADRGVALDGLARHHTGAPTVAGLVLGYAGPSRAELDRALPVVTAVLRRSWATRERLQAAAMACTAAAARAMTSRPASSSIPASVLGAVEVGRPRHRQAAVPLGPQDVAVADVRADQRLAAGDERLGEGPQHAGQRLPREVEQRPPAEHAAERGRREVELGRRGDGEPQVGVLPAGVLDHARRQVDARGVQAELGEVRGDGAGAAADVQDRAEPADGLRERGEHGP